MMTWTIPNTHSNILNPSIKNRKMVIEDLDDDVRYGYWTEMRAGMFFLS